MVEFSHNFNFPTATELLDKNVRSKLRTSEIEKFIEKMDLELSDSDLLDGLRRLRNLFAEGGQDIAEVDWGKWEEKIKVFFECFVREEWSAGVSVVLQLLSNMSTIYPIKFLTNENVDDGLLERLSFFNSKVINFFTAAIYNTLKRYYVKEHKLIVSSDRLATICLFLIKKSDEETAKEGWTGLLFSYLWSTSPEVFSYMLDRAKEDTLPTILEFLTDQMKAVPVGGESQFPIVILDNLREFFFLHCNCLLQGGTKAGDSSPVILFEVLKFMGPASSRHKEAFATEPMLVSICGIMKRCWEISQDHKDELQPRLVDGGELPKKSEFLEIMFSVWKDAVRIFANILGYFLTPQIKLTTYCP